MTSALGSPKVQRQCAAAGCGQSGGKVVPGDAAKYRIMGAARKRNGDLGTRDADGPLALHEVAIELWRIAVLEAAELAREHGVERVGDHRIRIGDGSGRDGQ